jgi:hypothetical protein
MNYFLQGQMDARANRINAVVPAEHWATYRAGLLSVNPRIIRGA